MSVSLIAASPARAQAATGYSDISTSFAKTAIARTAITHDWMTVSGSLFHPLAPARRWLLARALVKAFGANLLPDAALHFKDVKDGTAAWRYANIAVSQHWMKVAGGMFDAAGTVTKTQMDVALVRAAALTGLAAKINQIRTSDGYHFKHSSIFGYSVVASQLGFHWNYPNAARRELLPSTVVERADLAYALAAAAGAGDGWRTWNLQAYDIVLPPMTSTRRKVVEFAIKYAEYPYVYAGESASGFDCSGFVWWVLRAGVAPASSRGYAGWPLAQRTSFDMARYAKPHVDPAHLKPLDEIGFDVNGANNHTWKDVGHAAIYLGNGWFIHSSGSKGGVSIDRVDQGWWHDAFVWGRHVLPSTL